MNKDFKKVGLGTGKVPQGGKANPQAETKAKPMSKNKNETY